MVTKTKGHCDICNRDFTSLETHNRTTTKHGFNIETQEGIDALITAEKRNLLQAQIIYDEVVVPICRVNNLRILSWKDIDKASYIAVAEKINSI